jgi:hypothetical protein
VRGAFRNHGRDFDPALNRTEKHCLTKAAPNLQNLTHTTVWPGFSLPGLLAEFDFFEQRVVACSLAQQIDSRIGRGSSTWVIATRVVQICQ